MIGYNTKNTYILFLKKWFTLLITSWLLTVLRTHVDFFFLPTSSQPSESLFSDPEAFPLSSIMPLGWTSCNSLSENITNEHGLVKSSNSVADIHKKNWNGTWLCNQEIIPNIYQKYLSKVWCLKLIPLHYINEENKI